MTTELQSIFATLQQHHIAIPTDPLPPCRAGLSWIWAANGIFKRGVDTVRDILISITPTPPTPGLAPLAPHVRYATHTGRIPGGLLSAILDHARRAGDARHGLARPFEQQYFITYRAGLPRPFRVALPRQDATATRVSYELTVSGQILVDIHSHHRMPAYFSSTDDRDDAGLSVSAVVGRIFDQPEIAVRANVYGHHMPLPALTIFDALASCRDTACSPPKRRNDADPDD
jgi:PRTRC genetic system protein A